MWRFGAVALSLLAAHGCTTSVAAPLAPAEPVAPPLELGALTEFVPAAGLRWLVSGSPRHFAAQPALAPLRSSWLTEQRLAAFAQATGVDLVRTERALVAGFDLGTLYLVDSSGWVKMPEEPFVERLAGSARVQRPHPEVWRVTGLVGSTPQALVRLDDALAAIAVRDPLLARLVEYRARGRLKQVVPALEGAALSALPAAFLEQGALRAYALGPLPVDELPQGAGLLSAASALGCRVELEAQTLALRVALAGAWQPAQDGEHLRALWQAVARSPVGSALGLEQTQGPVSVQASERTLELAVELDAARVLAGLEAVAAGRFDPLLNPALDPQSPGSAR